MHTIIFHPRKNNARRAIPVFFPFLIFHLILLATLGTSINVSATDRYVSPVGKDTGGNACTNKNNPCQTIQYTKSQSSKGDVIHISEGIFTENVYFFKDLTLTGDGPDKSVVDGGGLESTVTIYPGVTVKMSNMTVQNGKSTATQPGGGGEKLG